MSAMRKMKANAGQSAPKSCLLRILNSWGEVETATAAIHVVPGCPQVWRRDDPRFAAEYDLYCRDADQRVVDRVRQRALQGDIRAMSLSIRAAGGFVAPKTKERVPQPLHPDVASAMLTAGFEALREVENQPTIPVINPTLRSYVHPRPFGQP